MPAVRFVVTGLVQGVGYRAYARRVALGLGVRGYARNLPDGTVEVLAMGDPHALEALEASLRLGPSFGRVDGVAIAEAGSEMEAWNSFNIS